MAEISDIRDAFDQSAAVMRQAQAVRRAPLSQYREHMRPPSQLDFVTKLRVGIRLCIARAQRENLRGRPERAVKYAAQAGRYWAEYREHWKHLLSLPGYRHMPTYGTARMSPRRSR